MDSLATRDPRKHLSKSFMVGADLCGERAFLDIHHPRPFVSNERMAFGTAVDAGIQHLIGFGEEGAVATDWAMAALKPGSPAVDRLAVEQALVDFAATILPAFSWTDALVQHHIRIDIAGMGTIDCHPDIILNDGTILDIKTASKAKSATAAQEAILELGFYAFARFYETGKMPPRVGYVTWVRSAKPYWQVVMADVTPKMIDRAVARAATYRRALEADMAHNQGREHPQNVAFPNGPRFGGLCNDCVHNPRNGGGCSISEE